MRSVTGTPAERKPFVCGFTKIRLRERTSAAPLTTRSINMLDIVMLAIAVGFFALSVGYTIACDRL
jgi:hypothetical protein